MPVNSLVKQRAALIRLAGACGIIGSVLPLVLIISATFLSSSFSWRTNALSDLGVGDQAFLFNGAVLLGGILSVIFTLGLREYFAKGRVLVVGTVMMFVGSVCLGLVGIFTTDFSVVHAFVALGYFLLVPLGFLLLGFGTEDGRIRRLSFSCGIGALASILVLPVFIFGLQLNLGFAVPELAESLFISVGVIFMSTKLLKKERNTQN